MREIPLVNGKGVALVDDEDFDALNAFRWRRHPHGYAITTPYGRTIYMHRFVLGCFDGGEVDHLNGDKLDNQRANLRTCSRSENMHNTRKSKAGRTSQYKGVSWSEKRKRWIARIDVNGKKKMVGSSQYEVAAAVAYDEAAREHHGEFARLNFPKDGERSALAA